jgi:thioredoxin reductase (NADPH)
MANFDVIVIGAGITGLTAAKAAVQSGLKTATIEALMFGGLVVNINELDGETTGSGTDFASNLMMEISDLGVENLSETVSAIARSGNELSVTTDAGTHKARAVIIASGARLKRLGIPGEAEFEYKGVSQCADCDGPMYKDEEVVVVGGGDSALQEALVLAEYAKRVHLVHRGAKFSAQPHFVEALKHHENIRPVWNSVAEAILGGAMVEKVRVRNTADNTVCSRRSNSRRPKLRAMMRDFSSRMRICTPSCPVYSPRARYARVMADCSRMRSRMAMRRPRRRRRRSAANLMRKCTFFSPPSPPSSIKGEGVS